MANISLLDCIISRPAAEPRVTLSVGYKIIDFGTPDREQAVDRRFYARHAGTPLFIFDAQNSLGTENIRALLQQQVGKPVVQFFMVLVPFEGCLVSRLHATVRTLQKQAAFVGMMFGKRA